MSKETGGSAFPLPLGSETTAGNEGMTLRDYFAAKAMQANRERDYTSWADIASDAYEIADAMLKARGE